MVSFLFEFRPYHAFTDRGDNRTHGTRHIPDVRIAICGPWMPSPFSPSRENRCDKTAFYSILTFVICTLLAQVVLTARSVSIHGRRPQFDFRVEFCRIYAVARKNIPIVVGFAVITTSQLVLGMCLVVFAARKGGKSRFHHSHPGRRFLSLWSRPCSPVPPTDTFRLIPHMHICPAPNPRDRIYQHLPPLWYARVFSSFTPLTDHADNAHTLDSLAFLLIILLAKTSTTSGSRVPGVLGIIVEDATRYFLVIFTSHFVLVMTLNLARVSVICFAQGHWQEVTFDHYLLI